jgi:hypothetical protein
MTGLLLRFRVWIANRLLDLGLIEAAKKIAPPATRHDSRPRPK